MRRAEANAGMKTTTIAATTLTAIATITPTPTATSTARESSSSSHVMAPEGTFQNLPRISVTILGDSLKVFGDKFSHKSSQNT